MVNPNKFLIFDAGPIISLTMNGLLDIIEKLKKEFDGEFIIVPAVKKEIIDKPSKIKKYALESVRVQGLFDKGVFKMSSSFINDNVLAKEGKKIMNIVNSSMKAERTGEKIRLIQAGEAECLAFSRLCKCDNAIVIDERTTRMLTEAPEQLRNLMEKKLHTKIDILDGQFKDLSNLRFIRSAELLYIAYKKNLFDLKKDRVLLDALLYGVKFKGCAISSREIEKIKKLA